MTSSLPRPRLLPMALTLAGIGVLVVSCAMPEPATLAPAEPLPQAGKRTPSTSTSADWTDRLTELQSRSGPQRFRDSVSWRMTPEGVKVDGLARIPADAKKRPALVRSIWGDYGALIAEASARHGVPAELLVAVIVEESGGRAEAFHKMPRYVSDNRTPNRIAIGLTGVLLSTARALKNDPKIDRQWLMEPANAIDLAAYYIARQYKLTGYDPPKVAAGYNSGGLYYDGSKRNRWRLVNYPRGRSEYIDNFVASFNEALDYLRDTGAAPDTSFAVALN